MSVAATVADANLNWWDDEEFQDRLVALLVRDVITLKSCAALLDPDDFKPLHGMRNGRARQLVAERALEYYGRYHQPLGDLMRADALQYAQRINWGAGQLGDLREYLLYLKKVPLVTPDALLEKVVAYKSARMRAGALQELNDLQATAGSVSDEDWRALMLRGLAGVNAQNATVDYLATLESRLGRRNARSAARTPWTFIEPLDEMVCTTGPQQTGLVIAPYKRGKSLFLLWLAVAFALQRLNHLHITLEDPLKIVEDRLDAIITSIPLKRLHEFPQHVARRFARFRAMVRGYLRVYDGTAGGITVDRIEQILMAEREQGRITHSLTVDYDAKIVPARRLRERRDEYDEMYVAMQQLASRFNLVLWTAAQTQRDTRHMKILSGDRVAEDINKIRNVTCALSLGKGEWTEESIYLWVAAHKCDRMEVGCEIVPDLKRMLIYDREATARAARSQAGAVEDVL